jgi:integrase/recombinase XerD
MQQVRLFKPSTVPRRFSVVAGFYRTCVIDGLLEHSPAGHVRGPRCPRSHRPGDSLTRQFDALLTAARESSNPCDFALVAMFGLLGLRIFEATAAGIAGLGDEHGHRVLRVCGKGTKTALIPLPPAVGRAIDRAIGARGSGPIPAQQPQRPDGPLRGHPPPTAAGPDRRSADSQATSAYAAPCVRHDHA